MKYKLVVKSPAEQDIADIIESYFQQNADLATKCIESVDLALNRISKNPEQYQKR